MSCPPSSESLQDSAQSLPCRLDVITKITDQVGTEKKNLHNDSPWRTGQDVMDQPDRSSDSHQFAKRFIILTEGGIDTKDSTS